MVNKKDKKYKKGLENLKKLTKQFNLNERCLNLYKMGCHPASIITNQNPKILESIVDEFERKFDALVYFIIFQDMSFGTVVNLLYISNYEEEWYLSDVDSDGYIYAATYNLDMNYYLEFGDIQLDSEEGVLYRKG